MKVVNWQSGKKWNGLKELPGGLRSEGGKVYDLILNYLRCYLFYIRKNR